LVFWCSSKTIIASDTKPIISRKQIISNQLESINPLLNYQAKLAKLQKGLASAVTGTNKIRTANCIAK
jgi:hypothetical protein